MWIFGSRRHATSLPHDFIAACASIVLAGCLLFHSPTDAWPQSGDRAVLQLFVNEVDKGEVLTLRRSDDILVRSSDLKSAGIDVSRGRQEFMGKESYTSLVSLMPGISYVLDEKDLAIRITGQAALQGTTKLNLSPTSPAGTIYSQDTSFFLNYAAQTTGFSQYNAFGEAGLSIAGHLLSSTINRTEDGHVVRGLSSLTINDRERLTRWIMGDNFVNNGLLGGSAFLAGVNVERNFTLDPYYYFFPRPVLSGTALVPSTVNVYSDGGLLRQETIAPGQFELSNLPVSNGYRTNRVVVRDIFGRETEIVSPFYLSTRVLKEGVSEYGLNAGFQRQNVTGASWDYDSPVMFGRYRLGVTNNLTPGVAFEGNNRVANGSLRLTAKSLLGEMDVSVAGSTDAGASGSAASIIYSYLQRWFSIGASLKTISNQYATVSVPSSADRAKVETTAFIGVPIGTKVNINLEATQSQFRDTGTVNRLGASGNVRLSSNWTLFTSNSWSGQEHSRGTYDFFVGLSYFFGNNTTGYVFAEKQRSQGLETNLEGLRVQKSLPVGPGYGYQVEGTGGPNSHGLGQFQYQGQYGRYEALYDSSVKRPVLTMSGGVIAIGGSVHATRVVDDGFVVIRTPGTSGVRGYINNQEIGVTDRRGEVVVPNNVLAYYGNRVSINDQDIPIDYRVDATERTVAPPFRGGALVVFPVARLQIVTGTLTIDRGEKRSVPAFGQLTVTAKEQTFESPIGKQGEFYLENIPPGSYDATIEDEGRTCWFILEVPESPDPILKLGEVHCRDGASMGP
ncbi:MAG TPA: fimbria/pilus outer membrane usher protein [Nitrospira sp.]|nr:fimbria/pilus outer membrane usher protein [Nitrospira sp.]